jgi:dienelactone hydrolase
VKNPFVVMLCGVLFTGKIPVSESASVKDLNTPRTFPKIDSKAEWQKRAQEIRERVLVSCGLWPMPEKTPLKAHVFGKMIRDGYSIEKVYFQSYPGFYVAGNLYRPLGKGKFPAILNPHGHWENGRMADTNSGSIAARCINFAKQGMIAFSYDMVGYNDTFFPDHGTVETKDFYKRHRRFATNEANLLWNINLMGLQTWNSIRALDFLESLSDVDKSRLACTGESGGGTQTYILGAIDERLAAQAPIVMVSHSMQGGCSCENAPGLRVEYSNMEIAAAAAPRPQIMIGATGDWTKTMMTIEGPAVESIYRLFNAENKLRYEIFDFPHNYNRTSREAVYDFFSKTLNPVAPASKETEYKKEPDEDLRVFPGGKLPADAVSEQSLINFLIANNAAQMQSLKPKDKRSFAKYKEVFETAWKHTLQLDDSESAQFELTFSPTNSKARGIVVLVDPGGNSAFVDGSENPRGLAKLLVERGFKILVLDVPANTPENQVDLFFTTYNRTFAQERVRQLVSACEWAKRSGEKVILCGTGRAGLWSVLAAPAADIVVADCDQLDVSSNAALLEPDLFIPGLRKIGAFEGVATLAAPHPILLHNIGKSFSTNWLSDVYSASKGKEFFKADANELGIEAVANWIARLK